MASDIPEHGQYIPNDALRTHHNLNDINEWTTNQKMIISEKKTKSMIINFTNNYQFGTRLSLNNTNLEIVNQMTILGTIITDKLKWDENCDMIIAKVNKKDALS